MLAIYLTAIAHQVGVSGAILLSICTVESGMRNINTFNDPHSGSFGVCSINLRTARSIKPYADRLALQQPTFNIEIAALYLKKHMNKYKNKWNAVAAYNAGHVTIADGIYSNQIYVDKVKKVYGRLAYGI